MAEIGRTVGGVPTTAVKGGVIMTGNQYCVGLGCDRGTSLQTLSEALQQALTSIDVDDHAIVELATIDKKHDEAGLLQLAENLALNLRFYSAQQLASVTVPSPSETVRKYMGTPAVAEAAALLSAGTTMKDLILEKCKYKGEDGKNATVSIAIARRIAGDSL